MSKQTVYLVESAASRCYTPLLCHCIKGMGVDVLTLGNPYSDRMEHIMTCIRKADAVLITGTPDTESAVVAGAAYALDRPVLHLSETSDLTSANVAAAVSRIIYSTDDMVATLRDVLQPGE